MRGVGDILLGLGTETGERRQGQTPSWDPTSFFFLPAARARPIPPFPLCDLLGWQCQAGRKAGGGRGQVRGLL